MEQRQIFTGPPAAAARSTAVEWSSSCYHDIDNYCIDINYISKSSMRNCKSMTHQCTISSASTVMTSPAPCLPSP